MEVKLYLTVYIFTYNIQTDNIIIICCLPKEIYLRKLPPEKFLIKNKRLNLKNKKPLYYYYLLLLKTIFSNKMFLFF
jgi:hypothetical protein